MKKISLLFLLSCVAHLNGMHTSGAPKIQVPKTVVRNTTFVFSPHAKEFKYKGLQYKGLPSPVVRNFPGDLNLGLPGQIKRVEKKIDETSALAMRWDAERQQGQNCLKPEYPVIIGEIYNSVDDLEGQIGILKKMEELNAPHRASTIIPFAQEATDEYPTSMRPFSQAPMQKSEVVVSSSAQENVGSTLTKSQIKKNRLKSEKEAAKEAACLLEQQRKAHIQLFSPLAKLAAQEGMARQNRLTVTGPTIAAIVLASAQTLPLSLAAGTMSKTPTAPNATLGKVTRKQAKPKAAKPQGAASESSNVDEDAIFAEFNKLNEGIKPFVDKEAETDKQLIGGLCSFWAEINQSELPWTSQRADLYSEGLRQLKKNSKTLKTCKSLLKKDGIFAQAYRESLGIATAIRDDFNDRYKDDIKKMEEYNIGLKSSFQKFLDHLQSLQK